MAIKSKGDTRPMDLGESYDDLIEGFVGSEGQPEASEEFEASSDPLATEYEEMQDEELNVEASDEESDDSEEDESQEEVVETELDSEPEVKEVLPDIEYVVADGQKVKVDFSDREKTVKAYKMAAGARKWQGKLDKLSVEHAELKEAYDKKEAVMNSLEEVKDNREELFRIITGGESLEDYVKEKIAEQDKISLMSPEQLDVYNKGLEHEHKVREIEKREAAIERQKAKNEEAAIAADHERQTALVHKAFLDNGFDGQLGDADLEEEENDALWQRAISKLSKFKDGVDVELINKTFKDVADHTRKVRKYNQDRIEKKEVKKQVTQATKAAAKAVFQPKQKTGIDELADMETEEALMSIFS